MKRIFALVLAVLMIAGSCVALSSCKKEEAGVIKIGLSGPLTGPAATYGQAVANSAQMAVNEINAAGGLSNGVKLELISTDDAHDPTKVATNFAHMLSQGMQVSLGCVTSDPCKEFAAMAKEENVFFLTPSASADDVVKEQNAYQMCFADGNQGAVAAAYVNGLYAANQLGKLGVLYKSGDIYSEGIYNQFMAALNADLKATIMSDIASYTGSDESIDFTAQVGILEDCAFIFMPIYATPAAQFMQAATGKVTNNATYYGCDGLDGIDGSTVEGFNFAAVPQKVSMLSHFNSKATEGKAAEYINKYKAAYPNGPLNQFGASAYDCVYALVGAMNAAIAAGNEIGADTTASDLCELLKAQFNGGFTYSGATGDNIQWEPTGFVKKGAVAYVIKEANG